MSDLAHLDALPAVPEFEGVDRARFDAEIKPLGKPAILRSLVADWPLVAKGAAGASELGDYLKGFATPAPTRAFELAAEHNGRFFYNDDFTGFNHRRMEMPVSAVIDRLLALASSTTRPSFYAGAVPIPSHLPGLAAENPLKLLADDADTLLSLWIGNKTRIPAHWDLPHNIAYVVRGARTFTLFPPDALKNLYAGPLDLTIAGQPCSIVDFHAPDHARFPLFKEALKVGMRAALGPGDALYIPSMWWHHVEADEDFAAMMNVWWREGPRYLNTPMMTLMHALLTLRDMPADEKAHWRGLMDHYIFEANGDPFAHLPDEARGLFGPMNEGTWNRLHQILGQSLGRR